MRGTATMSLIGLMALTSAILAGATIWLLLTDPVGVAGAFQEGEVSPLVSVLARALVDALSSLLQYL
ncbi:MAG: hypothetical protein EHM13_04880 [Acidobacteria bacterium]|nr:MAG: hypothetical protein EHM13_04880 [Acidobacteriota bacterium]